MDITQCTLEASVVLGTGSFGDSGKDTVTLSGYRMTADISKNGTPAMNTANVRIYGLNESVMNTLSRVGLVPTAVRNNLITVKAGLGPNDLSLAFTGAIMDAWADYDGSPDVPFNITAATGYVQMMKPVLPSSYPGATDVTVIMKDLAGKMGYTLENSGVKGVILSSPYLPGTARQQAMAAAAAADIFVVFEDDQGIMAIFPKFGARATTVPLISPDTGMVGYPGYIGPGQIRVRSEYNPAVRFMGNIKVKSSNTPAEGLWRVTQLTHNLSCQMPDGDWFTEMIGNKQLAAVQ